MMNFEHNCTFHRDIPEKSIISSLTYYTSTYWNDEGDSRIFHYPFMSSGPWSTIAAVVGYLYFVKVSGPQLMKWREPFQLKEVMICYNFIMVAVSAWMFMEGCLTTNFGIDSWSCTQSQSNDSRETILNRRFIFVTWIFFFTKLIEFADTIFMVLRKKSKQISNLHVIHHSVVPVSVWIGIKFAPVAVNAWFPLMNSLVHTLMYTYFALMALGPSLNPAIQRKVLLFKPWLTRVQIIQFLIALIHWTFLTVVAAQDANCTLPRTYFYLSLGNALLFLALFTNFYRQSYTKKVVDEIAGQLKSQVNQAVNACNNAVNQAADAVKNTTNNVTASTIVAAISSHAKIDKIE